MSSRDFNPKASHTQDLRVKSQARAIQLLQRENFESKKAKLLTLLNQQYCSKFGNLKNPQQNSLIKESVGFFINSLGENIDQISPKLIAQFETILISDLKSFKDSINSSRRQESEQVIVKDTPGVSSNQAPARVSTGEKNQELLKNENFSRINGIYNIVCDEEEKKQKISDKIKKQQEFRESLSQQVRTQAKQLENPYNLNNNLTSQINSSCKSSILDTLYNSEYKNEQKKQQKLEEERRLRQEQINEKKVLKERQLQEKLNEENQEVDYYNRLIEEEKIKKMNEKLKLKDMQEQFIQENLKNLEIKKMNNSQSSSKTLSATNSNFFILENRDTNKGKAKVDIKYEEFLRNMEKKFKETDQKKQEEYEKLTDSNKNLLLNKLNNINGFNASNSSLSLRKKQQECTDFNKSLIENKKRERELERENDRKYRIELQKMAEKEENDKKLNKEKKYNEFNQLKVELQKQIEDQHVSSLKSQSFSSSHLLDSNQLKLIEKIENDPVLMQKVVEKMKSSSNPKSKGNIMFPESSNLKDRKGSSKLALSGKKSLF